MSIANEIRHKLLKLLLCVVIAAVPLILSACGNKSSSTPPPVTATFPVTSKPNAPIGISAVAGDGTVTLDWSSVASAATYNVYRSFITGGTGSIIAPALTDNSYSDKALTNGQTYYYYVRGVNSLGEGVLSSEVSATPGISTTTVTISGTVKYQDKEYGINGFTANQPYKSTRFATVELIESTVASTVLNSTITGSDGSYSMSIPASFSSRLYIRVISEATLSGVIPQIGVKNRSSEIYGVASGDFTPSGPTKVNISIPAFSIGGAFNILDVLTSAYQFSKNYGGSYLPSTLFAFWQVNSQDGTYFCMGQDCPLGDGIYVFNIQSGDTDEYDDDVLYHEFGHFIAAYFSKDESLGGMHRLTDNDLDMRLTWSEGWGDAFPGAVKTWLNSTTPDLLSSQGISLTHYVDTRADTVGIAIDMHQPDGTYAATYYYASNEVAVAKILLGLNQHIGMQHVWDVFSDFMLNPPLPGQPVNLELFWDRWHSLGKPVSSGPITVASIFNDRFIKYSDLYSNNTFSTATSITELPAITSAQTLYGVAEENFFVFSAKTGSTYSIASQSLTSGADTYIELYAATDLTTPIAFNDNSNTSLPYYGAYGDVLPSDRFYYLCESTYGPCHENRSDILSSSISNFRPLAGTYYIKVYSSPTRPLSAGRYGTYRLSVTGQ